MKQIRFSAPFSILVLRLAICALLIASANQSVNARESKSSNPSGAIFATSAADGGRLVIKRSPVLGYNVSDFPHDRRQARRNARAGPHLRQVHYARSPYFDRVSQSLGGDMADGTLDVRPGETYSYTASYNVNKLVLTPMTGSR